MTVYFPAEHFTVAQATAERAPTAIGHNRPAPHVFDLHPALHVAVFGGFFVYLGIMWSAFADPGLAIPFVIFAFFIAAFFVVPAMWARMAPVTGARESWADFLREGMDTGSGRLSAGSAIAQVMIMPAMLILWGVAVAIIRATV